MKQGHRSEGCTTEGHVPVEALYVAEKTSPILPSCALTLVTIGIKRDNQSQTLQVIGSPSQWQSAGSWNWRSTC